MCSPSTETCGRYQPVDLSPPNLKSPLNSVSILHRSSTPCTNRYFQLHNDCGGNITNQSTGTATFILRFISWRQKLATISTHSHQHLFSGNHDRIAEPFLIISLFTLCLIRHHGRELSVTFLSIHRKMVNVPKTRRTYCKGKPCKKHT